MILHINTTSTDNVEVIIKDGATILDKKIVSAHRAQAEELLPLIDDILKKNKISLDEIKKIQVVNDGDEASSFTALRIGVVTANALGYALGIPVEGTNRKKDKLVKKNVKFSIVEPKYNKGPNITKKKVKM